MGRETKTIEDADTGLTGGGQDFNGVTILGDYTSSGTEFHWKTTRTFDAQGRLDAATLPSAQVKKHYYSKLASMLAVHLAYNDYEVTPKWYGPVSYTVTNHAGKPTAQATVSLTSNESTTALTGHVDETDADLITAMDLGTVAQLSTHVYDLVGQQESESRLYFLVPGSGAGSAGTNYDKTLFGYDDMGRRWRTKTAAGTVSRTMFDVIGRTASHWVGTNDNSGSFPGGDVAGTENMVKTDEVEYDGGSDMADGRVTSRTAYIQDNTTGERETIFAYDVQGNLILQTNPQAPHAFHKVDNQGRTIATGLFSSTGSIVVASDDPTTETANRMALSQTFFDERGQVWKSQRHKIDDADGSDDDTLLTSNWYDSEGRLIKTDGGSLSKTNYDRLGRTTHRFELATVNDSVYADADDLSGDVVLVEDQTTYDATTGYVLMTGRIDRFHDDRGGSPTLGALDTNADGDRLMYTAANVEGRVQISSMWYDRFGRELDRVEYGTFAGADFDRDGLSVPTRSDVELRSTREYNTDGTLKQIADPKNLKTYWEYDAAGRRTKEIKNYGDGAPSGDDSDQTVIYAYTNGHMTTLTADMPSGSDQVTTYTYGVAKGASAGDSKFASSDLLWKVAYPDSSGDSDTVKHAYNAQGQVIWQKDQDGNIQEFDFDTAGRGTQRRVTTLAGGFDAAVRRIATTYDSLGRMSTVTQHDNATVGSGSVVDEVKNTYDDWGNLLTFEQDRNGTVGANGDQYVATYAWEKNTSGRNALRKTGLTLSVYGGYSGAFAYTYGTGGGRFDNDVSRATNITYSGTTLAQYDYNGLGSVVGTDYPEPDVMSFQYTTSGVFPDLDRFNRPIKSKWTKDLATDKDFYSIDVTWDRNSNITLIEDNVHTGFDVSYTLDNLNRLTAAQEGTWSGSLGSEKRHQEWSLTHTGNWYREKLDLTGDNDWGDANEHDDTRTHNVVNELTARDIDTAGGNDYTLTYDGSGNLTDDGQSFTYEWDAFGRLRKVKNRSNAALVAEYTYNGLGFRVGVHQDTDNNVTVDGDDKWYFSQYDERWRQLAVYRESDTSPKEVFVNHQAGLDGHGGSSYIDLVVCRLKDANTAWTSASDGVLEGRHYYCQNWHADVSVLVTATGTIVEWDKYLSYGTPFGLPGADTDSDGDCDATDITQIQTWIDAPAYDLRGDVDLDGDVDATDKSSAISRFQGLTLGFGVLGAVGNRKGDAGYEFDSKVGQKYLVRHRVLAAELGRWISRDPLSSIPSLYEYASGRAITERDPNGLQSQPTSQPSSQPSSPKACDGFADPNSDECQSLLNDYIAKHPDKPVPSGITGCIDGNIFKCEFYSSGDFVDPVVLECLCKHENKHAANADCHSPTGYSNPHMGPESDEISAYNASIKCLADAGCTNQRLPCNKTLCQHCSELSGYDWVQALEKRDCKDCGLQ